VYSWTDEWFNNGHEILDWNFGITDRNRNPKPAFEVLKNVWTSIPLQIQNNWPKISVVVCTYNGSRTIGDTLEGISKLAYKNFEVIIVNDGSTDGIEKILSRYNFKVINIPNGGLSNARNIGWKEADGEIVAYIDDDAWPDRYWLHYLAHTFSTSNHVGVGGPNLAPPGDGIYADCVYNSPGGPLPVLISDTQAEHIPGCNMAFRKNILKELNGFDGRFRIAGDDVDMCWRILESGHTLGFNPAALVWHHRRNSFITYLKQQYNYGRAEAMLEDKWKHRYNESGHVRWSGTIYGRGLQRSVPNHKRIIYHGVWGQELFQTEQIKRPGLLQIIQLLPEFYLILAILFFMGIWGFVWQPLYFLLLICFAGCSVLIWQAIRGALDAGHSAYFYREKKYRKRRFVITAFMHFLQPIYRLRGRLQGGLRPWTIPSRFPLSLKIWHNKVYNNPASEDSFSILNRALSFFTNTKLRVSCGGPTEIWDLEIRGGLLTSTRFRLLNEIHAAKKMYTRFHYYPYFNEIFWWLIAVGFFFLLTSLLQQHKLGIIISALLLATVILKACYELLISSACFNAFVKLNKND
jgi:glycosyltransferase involved in cell wall biosynthesis